jgi:hypothetical protein
VGWHVRYNWVFFFNKGPIKDHSSQVWLKLENWFQSRCQKYESLHDEQRSMDDRCQVMTIAHSSHGHLQINLYNND